MRTLIHKLLGKDRQPERDWRKTYAKWVNQGRSLDLEDLDPTQRYWNDIAPLPNGFRASDDELRFVLNGLFSVGRHLLDARPSDWPPSTVALKFSWPFMARSEVVIYFDPNALPFEKQARLSNEYSAHIGGDALHLRLGLEDPEGFECEGVSFGSMPDRFPSGDYDQKRMQSDVLREAPDEQLWVFSESRAG